jgi:hypothetical protein
VLDVVLLLLVCAARSVLGLAFCVHHQRAFRDIYQSASTCLFIGRHGS